MPLCSLPSAHFNILIFQPSLPLSHLSTAQSNVISLSFHRLYLPFSLVCLYLPVKYGDGGKTFVLLYSALLSSIAEKVNESDSSVLRNRLTEIRRGLMALRHLLSREEDDIRALFSMGTTMPLLEDKDAVKRLFAASLRSGAGVTGNVAQKLAGTLTEFLCASSDSGGLDSYHVENTIKVSMLTTLDLQLYSCNQNKMRGAAKSLATPHAALILKVTGMSEVVDVSILQSSSLHKGDF